MGDASYVRPGLFDMGSEPTKPGTEALAETFKFASCKVLFMFSSSSSSSF